LVVEYREISHLSLATVGVVLDSRVPELLA